MKIFFCLFCLLRHTKHEHSLKGEIFFFTYAITILSIFTYSVCDEKVKYLLDHSIGYILDVSVNAKSFPVQCFVIASAALTRERVLHFLPQKVEFYPLHFHVIDIERLFQCNILLYHLKECLFT